ncbi:Predicted membrane protein [Phaffia rhodozyma]|uniref:Predicted membrane protein n=1 Tax=Phaffia rhodozyma TaxID=264483 RepID=A0A0F7SR55_PHARH|nr:Predicted membrane protein [Phaffia rhodozyma]
MIVPSDTQLSSIFGWISIACWIVVYTPQIWENYVLQSGEGLSIAFIVLWFIGDVTNLVGGAMAGLLPTMIILASYYSICDIVLLFQVYYYRQNPAVATPSSEVEQLHVPSSDDNTESSPLLPKSTTVEPARKKSFLIQNAVHFLAFGLVFGTALVAWGVNVWGKGNSHPPTDGENSTKIEWKSQTLGWISAVTYIGSRVPQIYHNWETRCTGLSLGMFVFTISGNLTYIASILFKSLDSHWIKTNLPWLLGSILTVFLDIAVICQFAYFSNQSLIFTDLATLQAQAERAQAESAAQPTTTSSG